MILWKQILRNNFTFWGKLADYLELTSDQRDLILLQPHFPLNLPLRLAQKIQKGTLEDPILRQFLPLKKETITRPGFVSDPVADQAFRQEAKLLRKYAGRVLLLTTGACAMNCRYCFRQHFDYDTGHKFFDEELAFIEQDPTCHEVILSGGDPLSLHDSILQSLFDRLCVIPHLKRIRFHTRFPIGIPERIDSDFLSLLEKIPQQVYFVLHSNHPREFDQEIFMKLRSLKRLGIVLLNQSVLLRGVNDDPSTLLQHCELLVDHGIMPYYLHQLDRIQGAGHFEVTEEEGIALIKQVSEKISGYAVPKYVREVAGQPHKTLL